MRPQIIRHGLQCLAKTAKAHGSIVTSSSSPAPTVLTQALIRNSSTVPADLFDNNNNNTKSNNVPAQNQDAKPKQLNFETKQQSMKYKNKKHPPRERKKGKHIALFQALVQLSDKKYGQPDENACSSEVGNKTNIDDHTTATTTIAANTVQEVFEDLAPLSTQVFETCLYKLCEHRKPIVEDMYQYLQEVGRIKENEYTVYARYLAAVKNIDACIEHLNTHVSYNFFFFLT